MLQCERPPQCTEQARRGLARRNSTAYQFRREGPLCEEYRRPLPMANNFLALIMGAGTHQMLPKDKTEIQPYVFKSIHNISPPQGSPKFRLGSLPPQRSKSCRIYSWY